MYMIIMIIIFKGIIIEITMDYLEIRDHNKHKAPHNLNSGLKRKWKCDRLIGHIISIILHQTMCPRISQ